VILVWFLRKEWASIASTHCRDGETEGKRMFPLVFLHGTEKKIIAEKEFEKASVSGFL
jgi:hypothetical protein